MSAQTASLIRATSSKPHRAVRTWPLMAPAVGLLAIWSLVPLLLTLWYAFQNYNLQTPPAEFSGLANFRYLLTDPDLLVVIKNTLELVFVPMAITIVFGVFFAVLYDGSFPGRSIARLLMITPFFVMPPVAALIWKNLILNPVWGLSAWLLKSVGLQPIDWFATYPMAAIIIIVSWAWTPFATLILADVIAVARPRASRSGSHGRGESSVDLALRDPAPSLSADLRHLHARDHLLSRDLRGDLRHDRRRSRSGNDQSPVLHLCSCSHEFRRRIGVCRRHFCDRFCQHRVVFLRPCCVAPALRSLGCAINLTLFFGRPWDGE